jgi:NitT/TauT family transport system substrate-binding protein
MRFVLKHLLPWLLVVSCASTAQAQVKVGVSDWTGWVAWYVAQDQGYFKKYGATVNLVWFANYSDSIAALSTGQLDANSQTWSDTLGPLAKGLPLKVVLVNDNSAGNDAVMVGAGVKSFADLRGHKVALEQYSISHFVLYTALARNGLTPRDVNVVNLSAGDAAAAFVSGRVDAAVVWNPWISQIEKSGKGRALFTSKEMPGLIPDLLVAQAQAVQTKAQGPDWHDSRLVRHGRLYPGTARSRHRDHGESGESSTGAISRISSWHTLLRRGRKPGRLRSQKSTGVSQC